MRLTIINELNNKMQVGVDSVFYSPLDATELPNDIHAVQWYGDHGEVEYKDPATGKMTRNEDIVSLDAFQFAIDAWNAAKAAEEAAIALYQAKSDAYQSAYDQAIANGDSEEDAVAAGTAASDAVTSL